MALTHVYHYYVCSLLCLPWCVYSISHHCTPCEIGKSCTLLCDVSQEQPAGDVHWYLKSGKRYPIPNCKGQDYICRDNRSRLKISEVTKDLHGVPVSCGVGDPASEASHSSNEIHRCKFQAFKKPQNPTCVAERTRNGDINVKCSTNSVFPALMCEISEIEDSSRLARGLRSSSIHYTEKRSKRGAVTKHICSSNVKDLAGGKYLYIAVMYPKIHELDKRNMGVASWASNPIVIPKRSVYEKSKMDSQSFNNGPSTTPHWSLAAVSTAAVPAILSIMTTTSARWKDEGDPDPARDRPRGRSNSEGSSSGKMNKTLVFGVGGGVAGAALCALLVCFVCACNNEDPEQLES